MNKILIAVYVACALVSTAYVLSHSNGSEAPMIVADASSDPT